MKKLASPIAGLVAGIAIGAFLLPGPYVYGNVKGATTRVNRFTGVEQYASSKGWVTQEEAIRDSFGSFFGGVQSSFPKHNR